MIQKLIRVQGVGLLHDALPSGAVELKRVVAIYAENGRGKTTWSTVCHSLATNEGQLVTERATIGGTLGPAVELLLDDTCYRFESGAWGGRGSNLVVFDSWFVDENVFSGSQIRPEHREHLLEFALGERGVALKTQVDDIANEIQSINRETLAREKTIRAYAGPYPAEEFAALRRDPDLDAKIQEAEVRLHMAENAQAVGARPTLERFSIPAVPVEDIPRLLSETVESVSDSAEAAVHDHIRLHLSGGGESWIGQGVHMLKADRCPFCGQTVGNVPLVKTYKEYFSTAYQTLKERISRAHTTIEQVLSEQALGEVMLVIQGNAAARSAWADRTDVAFAEWADPASVPVAWRAARDGLLADLDRKAAQPLDQIALSETTASALSAYAELQRQGEAYSNSVATTNATLQRFKEEAATAQPERLRADLERLKVVRKRFAPEVVRECTEFVDLRAKKSVLENEKAEKRRLLDSYTDTLMASLMTVINEKLSMLGAEQLSIVEMKASYSGGKPRSDYRLRLRGTDISLTAARGTSRCFSNTLGDGDRRTLALAFFLARMETDPDIATRTAVVDDPVSSFDVSRRRATLESLAALAGRVSQLVVMSHNADFVRDFSARVSGEGGDCQVLQIRRSGVWSIFCDCNIDEICESTYYANYRRLRSYLVDGCVGNLRPIAVAIRPYVERALRERLPMEFAGDDRLGRMISRIRNSRPGSALHSLTSQLADITTVNEYASRFHHDANPNADVETTTDGELRPMVELALKLGTGLP